MSESNYGTERYPGDLVVTGTGNLVMLTQLDIDDKTFQLYDLGVQLRPTLQPVKLTVRYRRVCSIADLLKLGKEHGLDFETRPEPELSAEEKQARYIQNLEARLAKLEAKQ